MSPPRRLFVLSSLFLVVGCVRAPSAAPVVRGAAALGDPGAAAGAGRASSPAATLDVALTVDDLPVHGPLLPGQTRVGLAERFVEVFRRHHLPPVFGFVNGLRATEHPDATAVLSTWVAAGNHLGNHSHSHVSLNAVSLPAYFTDVDEGEVILDRFEPGWRTTKTFRFPFLFEGNTTEKREGARQGLRARGYVTAEVTVEADDWAFNAPFGRCSARHDDAALVSLHARFVAAHLDELARMRTLTRRLAGRDVRHVLLLHLGIADADALDELLTAYEQAGVRWISLPEALGDPFYALDPGAPFPFGASFPYLLARARGIPTEAPIYGRGLEQELDRLCR